MCAHSGSSRPREDLEQTRANRRRCDETPEPGHRCRPRTRNVPDQARPHPGTLRDRRFRISRWPASDGEANTASQVVMADHRSSPEPSATSRSSTTETSCSSSVRAMSTRWRWWVKNTTCVFSASSPSTLKPAAAQHRADGPSLIPKSDDRPDREKCPALLDQIGKAENQLFHRLLGTAHARPHARNRGNPKGTSGRFPKTVVTSPLEPWNPENRGFVPLHETDHATTNRAGCGATTAGMPATFAR